MACYFDIIIIGSGAGGATLAPRWRADIVLAAAGAVNTAMLLTPANDAHLKGLANRVRLGPNGAIVIN